MNPQRPGFVEPRSLVFWMFVALVPLGVLWQVSHTFDLFGDYPDGIIVAAVAWIIYGVVVGWFIYRRQLFERRPVAAAAAAIVWGFLVAGGVTAVAGEELRSISDKLLGFETSREWGAAWRAPLVEESMKYLGVVALALIARVRLTRVVDGIFYGMLAGFGFLISENIVFSLQEIAVAGGEGIGDAIFGVMLTRGIVSLPLSHVVYTGIAGAGIGYLVSRRGRAVSGRLAVAAGLYATAFMLHAFQNSPILDDIGFNLFIKGLPALVVFLLVLRWGRNEYRSDLRAIAGGLPSITDDDMERLATKRRRKKAVKASDDPKQAKLVQHGQIELLVATDIYGKGLPESFAASHALATARAGAS